MVALLLVVFCALIYKYLPDRNGLNSCLNGMGASMGRCHPGCIHAFHQERYLIFALVVDRFCINLRKLPLLN